MDILFPWRKSLQSNDEYGQQQQHQHQQPPLSNSSNSNGDGGYHSLPHPQEHAQHYGGATTSSSGGAPSPRNVMMQSNHSNASNPGNLSYSALLGQSQRSLGSATRNFLGESYRSAAPSFAEQSAAPSRAAFGTSNINTGNNGGRPPRRGVPRGRMAGSGGGSNNNIQSGYNLDMMNEYSVKEEEEGDLDQSEPEERPKFRAPMLDKSERSVTSDISEQTGAVQQHQQPQTMNGMMNQNQNNNLHQSQQSSARFDLRQSAQGQEAAYYQSVEPNLIPVEEQEGGDGSEYYNPASVGGGSGVGSVPVNDGGANPMPDRRAMMADASGRSFSNNSMPDRRAMMARAASGTSFSNNYQQQQYSSRSMYSEGFEEEEEDLPVSPLRQLLDAINMSILPTSLRLSSLAQAVEFFDHRDRAMHDAELREGGAFVLYHKLGLVLRLSKCGETTIEEGARSMDSRKKAGNGGPANHYLSYQQSLANSLAVQQQSEFDKEIAMICSCLEMVHRANPDAIAQTWDECGTEILPLLVQVLERPFQKIERAVWLALEEKANVPGGLERAVAMAVTRDQKLAVQKVTKVLAMYSLVPEAKKPMCDCVGMLRWVTRIIDTHNYNRVKPGAPAIGGTTATSTSGGMSGGRSLNSNDDSAEDKAKRLELAARATSGSGLYMTEAARFNTIATLTNLAALEDNRMPMLREPGLLDNICRAVHNERSDVPKQCSALAIMNLSNGDMDHVPEMARNDLVLETLLKLMKEENPETRRNAVVTIFNVACSDQNTVRLARYRDGTILEALVELVGSDDPFLRTHDEARANAAETLFNMACSEISETTDRMANHAGLLECLAVTLRGEHTGLEVKMYCSATLRRMAEIIRHPMIAQGALLSALVKAATWTNTDCIAEAFRAQASVPENCVIMAHHHGLLNGLSRLALTRGEGPDVEKVRMASCLAIELMSRQDEARALLSQNEGIIMALTKASYGEDQRSSVNNLRMSGMSDLNGSVTGFMDASGRSGTLNQDNGEGRDSDDDQSMQSRRIQLALKNLVAAM